MKMRKPFPPPAALAGWATILLAGPLNVSALPDGYLTKPDGWYEGDEGRRVTTEVLLWQSPLGGWPKNVDTTKPREDGSRGGHSTFDNGATTGELQYLARAFRVTWDDRCRQAALKAIDHILQAQYASGGWPQYSPPPHESYPHHITFNDGVMVRLLEILRRVATVADFDFVDSERRKAAKAAFDRGIQCILKCQIIVDGKPTVWCAQHDEVDYRPRPGRAYELASLSGAESAGILCLLMSLNNPGPEVIRAVQAGAKWFASARLTGIRQERVNRDRVVVPDPNAPPLWARFYEIKTGRPIFVGRDGQPKYNLAEIEAERRRGYAWYGPWGEEVATAYAEWSRKWLTRRQTSDEAEAASRADNSSRPWKDSP
jgi:pectate lyase